MCVLYSKKKKFPFPISVSLCILKLCSFVACLIITDQKHQKKKCVFAHGENDKMIKKNKQNKSKVILREDHLNDIQQLLEYK